MPNHPEAEGAAIGGASDPIRSTDLPTSNGVGSEVPRLVHRDQMAYVEGCGVPIWRLEMARRAGDAPESVLAATPGLTLEGLHLAWTYADQHADEMDAPIRDLSLDDVPPGDEEDDEDEYQAGLNELFEEYGEVFRRLAQ